MSIWPTAANPITTLAHRAKILSKFMVGPPGGYYFEIADVEVAQYKRQSAVSILGLFSA